MIILMRTIMTYEYFTRYNMSMTCAGHFMRDCPDLDDYKFYLAFENSLCSEYVTEKVWWNSYSKVVRARRPIKDSAVFPQGAVPIVMGGLSERDYSKIAPPNSYLHIDQFEGPKHLAAKVGTFQTFIRTLTTLRDQNILLPRYRTNHV